VYSQHCWVSGCDAGVSKGSRRAYGCGGRGVYGIGWEWGWGGQEWAPRSCCSSTDSTGSWWVVLGAANHLAGWSGLRALPCALRCALLVSCATAPPTPTVRPVSLHTHPTQPVTPPHTYSPFPPCRQVGSDDDGYPVRMRFDHFMRYCVTYPHHAPADDSPLYIFDGTYGDRSSRKAILGQYSVPHLFPEDIFGLVGERRRPPYRWVHGHRLDSHCQ
jgi:hypothetical protein